MRTIKYFFLISLLLISLPAAAQNGRKLFIVHLRGGLDPLSTVQPLDTAFAARRPYLYRPSGELHLLPARGGVLQSGAHPAFPELVNAFNAGEAAIIHRVGYNRIIRDPLTAYDMVCRGVNNIQSSETRGWLQRWGTAKNLSSGQIVSLTADTDAIRGTSFEAVRLNGLDTIVHYDRDDTRDVPFRHDTIYNIMGGFTSASANGNEFLRAYSAYSDTSDSIRAEYSDHGLPPTGNAVDRYQTDSFGYRFREAEFFLRFTEAQIVYLEVPGSETYTDQRRRLEGYIDDLDDALATFRTRMKTAGRWNSTVVLVITDGGRAIPESGKPPLNGRIDQAYTVGSNFGGAFDAYVFSGALARGGTEFGGYTRASLTGSEHLTQQYHLLDIYSEMIEALGYNTSGIIESYNRSDLNLF